MESLGADVCDHTLQHPFGVGFFDEADVNVCDGAIGNDRARLLPDVTALQATDVERRILQRFLEIVADLLSAD